MFLQKHRAKGALKFCATSASIILAGGAALLMSGCPEPGPYVCANGAAEQGTTITRDETRCVSCNPGYRLDGTVCATNTYACANGVAAAGRPKSDGEMRCEQCNPTFRLVEKLCVPTAYSCNYGTATERKDGMTPTAHGELHCASCDTSFHLENNICVYTCPTGFHKENNICVRDAYACPNGDPFPPPTPTHGTVKCLQCDAGYHLNAQEACEANAYVCKNGTPPSTMADTQGQQECMSCDTGFDRYNDAATGISACTITDGYVCVNGTPASGTTSTQATQNCASCDTGYHKEGTLCVANQYTCPNGNAARGIPGTNEEARCASCNQSYGLQGTECVASVYEQVVGLASLGGILYMTGSGFNRLYTVDTATGAATAVGSTSQGFGVGETAPRDLAAMGGTLYMVGSGNDRLYTLDTATGAATAVNPALEAGFGVDESDPWGLAVLDKTLYMAGDERNRLYVVDAATAVATPIVGLVSGVPGNLISPYHEIGNALITGPRGLAVIGDTLYIVDDRLNHIYTVDPANATVYNLPNALRTIGGFLRTTFYIQERDPAGLAAIGDTIYMGGHNSRFYTVDPDTGAGTLVGLVEVLP